MDKLENLLRQWKQIRAKINSKYISYRDILLQEELESELEVDHWYELDAETMAIINPSRWFKEFIEGKGIMAHKNFN